MEHARDLDKLLWDEMTEAERTRFGEAWVEEYARDLVVECGLTEAQAREIAPLKLDGYLTQTVEARDEAIRERRHQDRTCEDAERWALAPGGVPPTDETCGE